MGVPLCSKFVIGWQFRLGQETMYEIVQIGMSTHFFTWIAFG